MKSAVLVTVLCLVAIGCASSTSPASEPKTERTASRSTGDSKDGGSNCSLKCQSYVHYRRGALLECEQDHSCGGARTNAETADYGRELRDALVAQCGESCPQAWLDAKKAGTAK